MSRILILTAVELEARALARHLELPALPSLPFPAFGRGTLRLAPVGLRAALLAERWPALRLPARRVLTFKPSQVLKNILNGLPPV